LTRFDHHEKAVAAVLKGDAAAFSSDGEVLAQLADGAAVKVVGNHFSDEPYGLGLPMGDPRFQQLVNVMLSTLYADGTMAAIYAKWLGDRWRPYPQPPPAETTADAELLTLATTDAPPLFTPVSTPAVPDQAYVVQPGDSLSSIAGKVYGDVSPASWKRIYEANKACIGDNPSVLAAGMQLTIPTP
jgi:phage tail protein X